MRAIGKLGHLISSVALYVLWIAVSMLLVFTGRLLKLVSIWGIRSHFLLGVAILVLSIIFSAGVDGGRSKGANERVKSFHTTAGTITFIGCAVIIANGIVLSLQLHRSLLVAWLPITRWVHRVRFADYWLDPRLSAHSLVTHCLPRWPVRCPSGGWK